MGIEAIIAAIDGVSRIINLIIEASEAAKQSGELSDEEEAELDKKIAELKTLPWWNPSNS